MKKNNTKPLKKLSLFLVIILSIILFAAYYAYSSIYKPNVHSELESRIVFIEPGSTFEDLSKQLAEQNIIKKQSTFEMVAGLMKYGDGNIKAGRYKIEPNWGNRQLISQLRSGRQEAVDLTFNNLRNLEQLAGRLSDQMIHDSLTVLSHLRNETVQSSYGFDHDNMLTMFIPNTYKIYWNSTMENFCDRMKKEHDRFWNDIRKGKAKELNLTPSQVYALASIVEKETLASSEKKRIAGLYLNRLDRGMLLQADPTVVYAVGDFEIRRVLNKHLESDSPYNTYKFKGLPPGPIYMPDISTIDASLSPEKHDYLFFCAKPDNSGLHAFAKTSAQHAANARKYHAWLNSNRIFK